jgi:hypothetical protein
MIVSTGNYKKMEVTVLNNEKFDEEIRMVEYHIPLRIYLSGERSLEEYQNIILENLRKDSSIIFELFKYLSHAAENKDFRFADFCKTINSLSGIGKGLQEAVEAVQLDYKRKIEVDEKPSNEVSTLSKDESKNAQIKNEASHARNSLIEQDCKILANKIEHVLASDKVSNDIKRAVIGVLYAALFEAREGFYDNPAIVRDSFPVIMRSLNVSYQKVYIHSIEHIFYESLPESVNNELQQYEKRFEDKNKTPDTELEQQDLYTLAELLSKVMKHPKMPVQWYKLISDKLAEVFVDKNSPDNILTNLKVQLEKEEEILR